MFGAASYLNEGFPDELGGIKGFGRSTKQAQEVLAYWMKTFSERHPRE